MIQVKDLHYSYQKKGTEVLKGISFSLKQGEILGFLGPSGAGKSTTQKIMIGLLTGYQGSVEVKGKEIGRWGRSLYNTIGVGFELPRFYHRFTALENLNFFGSLYSGQLADPMELLERFGLSEHADKRVGQFSKGMKTRLGLCRALIHQPELIFLDEPTTGLDPATSRSVRNYMKELKKQGHTIFLTTHSMEVAEDLCDRVAFIHQGEIHAMDSPANLMQQWGKKEVELQVDTPEGTSTHKFPKDKLGENKAFLDLLKTHPLRSIHSSEASLEDIFVELTGRGLL